ncbi:hypothetical protein GGI09_003582, partial [Coemansia sp. S100]
MSTSTAHVSRATQQAAHDIASPSPFQTAASAQPTLPGNVDRTADTLCQFKPIIDGWMHTWNNNNPTQPLPPDIREKVKTFIRLVAPSSAVEVETAASASDNLDVAAQPSYGQSVSAYVVAQPDAFQLALDIQDAVGSSCAPVGQPILRLHSPDRAGPSLHIVDSL